MEWPKTFNELTGIKKKKKKKKKKKNTIVIFYRQHKTLWYQFCHFKHFLKAENSEDSLASSEFS